jgi:predicted 3-demethylubiquinone-9 3-methyltransferase (glyoxalase superfamily)
VVIKRIEERMFTMSKITTFLMFEGQAEEAMNLYMSLFDQSEIKKVSYYGSDVPGMEGKVEHAIFSLNGQEFMCFNSHIAHEFTFTPSMSLYVELQSEEEIEGIYEKLSDGGSVLMPLDSYPFSKKFTWISDDMAFLGNLR